AWRPSAVISKRPISRDLHPFPTRRSSDLWRRGDGAALVQLHAEKKLRRAVAVYLGRETLRDGPISVLPLREFVLRLADGGVLGRSEEHTSELQSRRELVCRLLLEKKKGTQ